MLYQKFTLYLFSHKFLRSNVLSHTYLPTQQDPPSSTYRHRQCLSKPSPPVQLVVLQEGIVTRPYPYPPYCFPQDTSPSSHSSSQADKTPASYPSYERAIANTSHQSTSSSSSTSAEQKSLSANRIAAYVNDPTQAQHTHASSQEAMQAHTNSMASYLEAFDAKMRQYEK